jgi:hypothetical protein
MKDRMDRKYMTEENADTWICHVCDFTSSSTESRACSVCYKVTCALHLQTVSSFNSESGLFELQPICALCAMQR